MKITYNGNTYNLPKRQMVIFLRSEFELSYGEIAGLMKVTRQAIQLMLRKWAPDLLGRRTYPELKEADIYDKYSDEEIAHNLGIKISTVQKYRRQFGYKRQSINVHTRQLRFVREVFGIGYKLGPLFYDNLEKALTPHLTPLEIKRIIRFYIRGAKDDPSLRVHRAYIREKLVTLTQQETFIKAMKDAGVITDV